MTAIVRCVFGQRGRGKSTLARELVAEDQKVLAFDPQRDYCGAGWVSAATRREVEAAILAAVGGPLRVSYTPDFKRADPMVEGAWLAETADIAQTVYPAADARPLTLLYDEADLAFPTERARASAAWPILAAVHQGRHRGIGLVFITRRPANLGSDARSQAVETYLFRMMSANDRKAVAEMHPDALRRLDGLKEFQFLRITDAGIETCVLRHRAGINVVEAA